jgi:hypothetical protein
MQAVVITKVRIAQHNLTDDEDEKIVGISECELILMWRPR